MSWGGYEQFQKALCIIKHIPVINDVDQRDLKLIENYNYNNITKDKFKKQCLLQVLIDYRKKYSYHKK